MPLTKSPPERGKSVVVIGGGGNIGSHLTSHLARMPAIDKVTVIDSDSYELGNLASQAIWRQDIGRSKAAVQARRLRRINPGLQVEPIAAAVESVPLGWLRGDLALTCLDTRSSRQYVNKVARILGMPWIDAGVEATATLVRVSAYMPGSEQACLECAWDDRDYSILEQSYPCGNGNRPASPTGASSSLGALAAAMQALDAQAFLSGNMRDDAFGRQTLLEVAHHRVNVTSFRQNPRCRLLHHPAWEIAPLGSSPEDMTLGEALGLGAPTGCSTTARGLRVEGSSFATRLSCTGCDRERKLLQLQVSLRPEARRCRRCGSELVAAGFDTLEHLDAKHLPARALRRSLKSIGLRPGDVISVGGPAGEKHYEIGGRRQDAPTSETAHDAKQIQEARR